MAVDQRVSRDTEAFLLPYQQHQAFYPTKIPIAHYQLRHFISSPEPGLIYYASGVSVRCLNTEARVQTHVTTLPWEARCTASGHGYVCIGGADEGNFAAIKVQHFRSTFPFKANGSMPRLSQLHLPRPPLLAAAHRIRYEKIGEDIVNSISIHKYPAQPGGAAEVVAVLTNNDKTVRVYSLTQNLELAVLDLPYAMNHATISPDSGLLVAVGDAPTAYFFMNNHYYNFESLSVTEGPIPKDLPQWSLIKRVSLYRPTTGPCADGYFCTAWSPSGRLCAVGSECGYITVFDAKLLQVAKHGETAVVQLISSTRPDTAAGAGAVRTIHFSPSPWDFLAWSEDQGRVCIADLRSGLRVKQVLTLDPKEECIVKAEIADVDMTLHPNLHEVQRQVNLFSGYRRAFDSNDTAAMNRATREYLEADPEPQRFYRQLGVVESDNDPHGLTAHERRLINAFQMSSQQGEALEQGIVTSQSINHNTARHSEGESRESIDFTSGSIAEPTQTWTRLQQQRTATGRQASVVVSIDPGTVNVPPQRTSITDSAPTRSPNIIPAHARRVTNELVNSTEDAWRAIEEALTFQERTADAVARNATANANSAGAPSGPEIRNEIRRLRQLHQMRERLRNARASQPSAEPYEFSLGLRRRSRSVHDPSQGLRTAGLAISPDGRTLYCGTEEGIFEFELNLHARREFPAIHPL